MELARIFRFVPGWVRAEAEGGYPERFLNEAARRGILLWGVRHKQERTRFCCFARDYRKLRQPAHRACVRMRLRQKHGLPFWLHRYRRRKGLLAGLVLYGVVLALLAPRIWVVQVVGNVDTPEKTILAEAEVAGVRLGAPMSGLDIKSLEIDGLSRLPSLSWITVNPSGCVARVEVLEREVPPQVLDLSEPSAMVAVRDGLIQSMTVLSGEPAVMVGEAVSTGTVLISGRKETELGERLSRAYGEVWAETQRQITVSVPLVYERQIPGENTVLQPALHFLRWRVPLYAPGEPAGNYRRLEKPHFLTAGELTLPLGVTNTYYVPIETVKTARTESQAAAIAEARLAVQQREVFAGAEYTETHRQAGVQGNTYVLTVSYTCRENIAVEVPLDSVELPKPDTVETKSVD